jgi:hypothetical protein
MSSPERDTTDSGFINVQKLAALDMVLHGTKLILAECVFTVLIGCALGGFIVYVQLVLAGSARSPWLLLFGVYMILIGLNYVPLLLYAIGIARRGNARDVIARDLERKDAFVRKYSLRQLVLLLPLVIPILAITQELRKPAPRQP